MNGTDKNDIGYYALLEGMRNTYRGHWGDQEEGEEANIELQDNETYEIKGKKNQDGPPPPTITQVDSSDNDKGLISSNEEGEQAEYGNREEQDNG